MSNHACERLVMARRGGTRALCVLATSALLAGVAIAEPPEQHPLEPPDTSSPRATLQGFLSHTNQAHRVFESVMKAYHAQPGLYPSEALRAQGARVDSELRRASRYLNLSEIPPTLLGETRTQAVLLLKEVVDRIEIPPLESVPDADMMEAEGQTRWRIPHTDLVISRVSEGPQEGDYLFTPTTVDRLEESYGRVGHLPYKPGAWEGVYELYLAYPDWTAVPMKLVERLPAWSKRLVWENAVWQWISFAIVILATPAVVFIGYRLARRVGGRSVLGTHLRRLTLPVIILGAAWAIWASLIKIGVTGAAYHLTVGALTVVFYGTIGWLFIGASLLVGEAFIASPGVGEKGLDAAFIRLASRLLAIAFFTLVLLWGAHRLGLPVIPLVAGLGVGGLALALAAQPTIENFIAGLTLYADRPVGVGEVCRVGEKIGIVEEIGMRSARVRTLDDTMLTIPNAEFSKMALENFSKRRKVWYHPTIRLRYEATPDQVRYVLVEVRRMLYAHPKVLADPARIRFAAFGAYSLDLEIFAYVDATDQGEFLGVAEDVNLRIMTIVAKAGTELAVPTQAQYTVEKPPLDQEQVRRAEATVDDWRAQQTLFLPQFPPEKIADLSGSLDYPPDGSPAARDRSRPKTG
jgi:MscS family membrane protein